MANPLGGLLALPIRAYRRWISPWTPASCRSRRRPPHFVVVVSREAVAGGGIMALPHARPLRSVRVPTPARHTVALPV